MYELLVYLCKLSISLAVVYLFYLLVLRSLTFYQWNRWYLLCYTAFSFYMPFIDIMPLLSVSEVENHSNFYFVPSVNTILPNSTWVDDLQYWDYLIMLFGVGIFILLIRFVIQIISLKKIKKKGELIHHNTVKIYDLPIEDLQPFSFGKDIYINTQKHSAEDLEKIIAHEFVHVKQHHTIDVLWIELLCIVQWYNPFVWLLKKSVKQNLEFIADQNIVNAGLDKKEYQYLLLKVLGNNQFSIANNFNFQSLKNRIKMMNKLQTTKIHLTKFLFLLPVLAVLLLSFRNHKLKNNLVKQSEAKHEVHIIDKIDGTKEMKENTKDVIDPLQKQKVSFKKDTIPQKELHKIDSVFFSNMKAHPLYLIDGVSFYDKSIFKSISVQDIVEITVLKDLSAIELYGEKGKNGVVVMKTKKYVDDNKLKEVRVIDDKATKRSLDEVVVVGKPTKVIIDEVRVVEGKPLKNNQNGEVLVERTEEELKLSGNVKGEKIVTVRKNKDAINLNQLNLINVLIIVDGEQVSNEEMQKISPNSIKEIEVLKDANARKYYGKKGENGVIIITTN